MAYDQVIQYPAVNWDLDKDGIDTTTSHTGNQSTLLTGDLNVKKRATYYFDMEGEAGTPIRFSGWSKAVGVNSNQGVYQLYIAIQHKDGSYDYRGSNFTTGTHDWEFTERVVTATEDFEGIHVYAKFDNQSAESAAWFDDFKVRLDSVSNAILSSYNITENGGFEQDKNSDGFPDVWKK